MAHIFHGHYRSYVKLKTGGEMETPLQLNDNEWEKLQSQMEDENLSDPHIFSRLLDNYLQKVKKVRSAYQVICRKIFML